MSRMGLRSRVVLVVSIVLALAFTSLWFALDWLVERSLRTDEELAVSQVADITVPLVVSLADDHSELKTALSSARDQAGLVLLQLIDQDGETRAPGDGYAATALLGRHELVRLIKSAPATELMKTSLNSTQAFVHVRPLPAGGYFLVARSASAFESNVESVTRTVMLLSLAVLLASALAAAGVIRSIVTRPVELLVRQAGDAASGSSPGFLSPEGIDDSGEFGVLRKSLRDMASKINVDRGRIETQLADLQRINQELRQAQEQLVRTEKLASVGQLAAGMAHEIGNPIGVILGYAEMLASGNLPEEVRRDAGQKIQHAVERIDVTIKDLLNYSRPASDESENSLVAADINNVLDLLKPQKRFRDITIQFAPDNQASARCSIPPSKLRQVLLNLLLNASDAMNGTGSISITMSGSGNRLAVTVKDSGPGIPDELLRRIFDPFFTTKEVGKGTGLGLFVCHTIVTTYGGSIEVQGNPGSGAAFTLLLPMAAQTPA